MKKLILAVALLFSGCTGIPEGVTAIEGFEVNRYLGKWYEIARLDHRFERGLNRITADYRLRDDGGLDIINSGYNIKTGEREQAEGRAYFTGAANVGRLKVSFWGPFYGGYNIIELDKQNYSYALVTGPDRDYLWILSRIPVLDSTILKKLIDKARALGFATEQLIFTDQEG
ncbi:MAG: lipocalin [Gammaproteobacteria bacterium HGW-Gammaproteobacteria-3]|jgi:apolipoprotein D and lipocalin family protein|nr:MAG: lipocalin [Gammaproteobacteria bacterium HGW-Gammaproteobacteria-3]